MPVLALAFMRSYSTFRMPFFPSFGSSGCCCFPVGLVPLIIIGVIIYIIVQNQQKKDK